VLDIDRCKEILENHFTNLTCEEFLANLEEFCQEFFFYEEPTYLESEQSNDPGLDRQDTEENKIDRGELPDEFMIGWIPKHHIDGGAGCFALAMRTIELDRINIPQCLCEPSSRGWFAQNIYRRIGSDSHQAIRIVSRIDRLL
jgi:hypothetical protein